MNTTDITEAIIGCGYRVSNGLGIGFLEKVIESAHQAQFLNYLVASGLRVGLILNFGTLRLGLKRMVR